MWSQIHQDIRHQSSASVTNFGVTRLGLTIERITFWEDQNVAGLEMGDYHLSLLWSRLCWRLRSGAEVQLGKATGRCHWCGTLHLTWQIQLSGTSENGKKPDYWSWPGRGGPELEQLPANLVQTTMVGRGLKVKYQLHLLGRAMILLSALSAQERLITSG